VQHRSHGGAAPPQHPSAPEISTFGYSAFGKSIVVPTAPGGTIAVNLEFTWQGKRLIGANLYDSRGRVWSADLGVFLQPDEYGFLTRSGTLWSWPGQNPFKWRDPSGRYAGVAAYLADLGALSFAAGELVFIGAATEVYAVYNIEKQLDDFEHPIVTHADPTPDATGKECPKAENSGGGDKARPPRAGDAAAASEPERGPKASLELAQQIAAASGKPPWAQTVSLLETAEGPTLVGAGGQDLTVAQKALAEELGLTLADDLPGYHAEETVIEAAGQQGLTPTSGVATNNVCPTCRPLITSLGGTVNGRLFWF
jgi:RHS repeat-associated protein